MPRYKEITRKGVENYYRCGYREARYSLDPSVARSESTPEEEYAVEQFMMDYDNISPRRTIMDSIKAFCRGEY